MKRIFQLAIALAFMAVLAGCESEDASRKYLIASRKGMYQGAWEVKEKYYHVYDQKDKKWHSVDNLIGMDYEYGTEYIVWGKLTTSEDFHNEGIADAESELKVEQIISQEVKTTQLPDNRAAIADSYEEYFGKVD